MAHDLGEAARKARQEIFGLIESGSLPPGSKLPGERRLAENVGVSRSVLRDALVSLAQEGVLESSPWRGWFVKDDRMTERVALQSFTDMALARGFSPGARVIWSKTRTASIEEARSLSLPPGAKVFELRRIRTLDGFPACYDIAVLALGKVPVIEDIDFEDASLYAVLEEHAGVRIVRSDYVIRAESASEDAAELLDLLSGSPVLVAQEVAHDAGGAAILFGRVIYRPDAYEFHATLSREL